MNPIRFGAVHTSLVRPGAVLKDNKGTTFKVESTVQSDYLPPDHEIMVFGETVGSPKAERFNATYLSRPYWGNLQSAEPTRIIDELDLVSHPKTE